MVFFLSVFLEVNGMWKSKTKFRPLVNFLGFRVFCRRGSTSSNTGSGTKGASGKGRKRSSVTSSTVLLQGLTGVPCRQWRRILVGSRQPSGWMMLNLSMTHIYICMIVECSYGLEYEDLVVAESFKRDCGKRLLDHLSRLLAPGVYCIKQARQL